MGLFDKLFGRRPRPRAQEAFWKTLTAYTPHFTTWSGQLYESELVRAAIDCLARASGKLQPTVTGAANPRMRSRLRSGPNPFQTWGQFLYRTRTILEMQNTAFIVPVFDDRGELPLGFFTVLPSQCEVLDVDGEPALRFRFLNGETGELSMDEVGILTKFQYRDDLFGENNHALDGIMNLLQIQRQGMEEAAVNSATFRFMAQMSTYTDPEDLALERKRFNVNNLRDESGGVLLWPHEYENIQQIRQEAYQVDAAQQELIRTGVFDYFGVNQDVLQNAAFGDKWAAFYEGAIEPFAIQLSDVLTGMVYTGMERARGNGIFFTTNRLQFMTNAEKTNVTALLTDRGIFSRNEARAVWNLPPVEGGDDFTIRGEYKAADSITDNLTENVSPPGGTPAAE